jgi:hypothetical protein
MTPVILRYFLLEIHRGQNIQKVLFTLRFKTTADTVEPSEYCGTVTLA